MGHLFCFLFCTSYTRQLTTGNGRRSLQLPWGSWVSRGTWEKGCESGVHAQIPLGLAASRVQISTMHSPSFYTLCPFCCGAFKGNSFFPILKVFWASTPDRACSVFASRPFLGPYCSGRGPTHYWLKFCWKLTPVAGDLLCTWILKWLSQ